MINFCDAVWLRVIVYGILFVLAFWCAAIAAPIMWRLEYNRQEYWPLVNCTVVCDNCCRVSCGKGGCNYQPDWKVNLTRVDSGHVGESLTGDYYGLSTTWYGDEGDAQSQMNILAVNSTFQCQYDINYPNPDDWYRYIVRPGEFLTPTYLVWTICMYAIGIPLCVVPALALGIYFFFKWALRHHCRLHCPRCHNCFHCKRSASPFKFLRRKHGIVAPAPYTPPAQPVVDVAVVAVAAPAVEAPRPDPFEESSDDKVNVVAPENPIVVRLPVTATETNDSVSVDRASSSGEKDVPAY